MRYIFNLHVYFNQVQMKFIFLSMIFVFFELVQGSEHSSDWIKLRTGSNYFKIFEDKLSIFEANKSCQRNLNSTLMTKMSVDNINILNQKVLSKNITQFWTGIPYFKKQENVTLKSDYKQEENNCVLSKNIKGKFSLVYAKCTENNSFVCIRKNVTDTQINNVLSSPSEVINQCPKPFFLLDGGCFWISSETSSLEEGIKSCKSIDGQSNLASINTTLQQEYFAALIFGNSTPFLIGLHFNKGKIPWISDLVVSQKWSDDENPESEKNLCTFMSGDKQNPGKFHSDSCSRPNKVICQTLKKKYSTILSNATVSKTNSIYDGVLFQKGDCEKEGYVHYRGSCYKLLSTNPKSHDAAIKLCLSESFNKSNDQFIVDLVNFQNSGEKYFILSFLRLSHHFSVNNGLWLGINGLKNENKTVLNIELLNNSRLTDFEYAPTSMKKLRDICFKMFQNGIINVSSCDEKSTAKIMCEYKLKTIPVKIKDHYEVTVSCPENWTRFNSDCYYFDQEIYQSQFEAKKRCMKLDAHLPSIDKQQQQFLEEFFSKKITNQLKDIKAWIGLEIIKKVNKNIEYKWMNEDEINFINIELAQVIHRHVGEKKWCSLFSVTNGVWTVVNCTETNASLLCQKPATVIKKPVYGITSPSIVTNYEMATKKKNDLLISKPEFKIFNQKLTWNESLAVCKALKVSAGFRSSLAVINEYSDILEIEKQVLFIGKPIADSKYWIGLSGLYDHFDNAFIRWSDNSTMVFQNYDYENLMNLTGNENCVVMDIHSGKWFAIHCEEKRNFICKIYSENDGNKEETQLRKFFNNNWPEPRFCPENFVEFSDKCYRVIEDKAMSWAEANNYCHNLIDERYRDTAYLVDISSTFENSFTYSLLSAVLNTNNDTRFWIGQQYLNKNHKKLCTAMSGHPDPYIGARWFTLNCATSLKFICSTYKVPGSKLVKKISKCRMNDVEYENSMGTSCYSFKNHPNNLKEAKHLCNLTYNDHVLTLQSHYHMHFIRSQLLLEGFSRDRNLWLGAEIESHQNMYNWQWYNNQPIRYTIWNKQPMFLDKVNTNLCFYFVPEKDAQNKLGIQVEPCNEEDRNYIICEYFVRNVAENYDRDSNSNCLKDIKLDKYEGKVNLTIHGRRCLRWDLLKLIPSTMKIISSIREDDDKHKFIQYHSNECRYIKNMNIKTTFCAFENEHSPNSISLETCTIQLCKNNISKTLHHEEELQETYSNTLSVVLVTLALFLCIIICVAMLSWRRWNKGALFWGYLKRSHFSFLNNQSRGTSFNNPIYRPIHT